MTDSPSLYEAWQAHADRYDADPATPEPTRTQRHDGWTPERQRTFLDAVADGYSAEVACRLAGMSTASAYAFRKRAAGQAFALGWRAASLLGRDRIADTMLARAVDGYTEAVTRPNGDVIERHRFDNRLAMSMLARLDRQAEAADAGSIAANTAARFVAAEFEVFLDLLGTDNPQARAGLFLARRADATAPGDAPAAAELAPILALTRADRYVTAGAALPGEVDTADLDPAARAGWTAEQWVRAEAAGLVRLAPAPEPLEAAPFLHLMPSTWRTRTRNHPSGGTTPRANTARASLVPTRRSRRSRAATMATATINAR